MVVSAAPPSPPPSPAFATAQLLVYTADLPELWKALGIKAAEFKCDQCWCPFASLCDYSGPGHTPRAAVQQRQLRMWLLHAIETEGITAAEEAASSWSTLVVPCGLEGFADRDTPATDLHR